MSYEDFVRLVPPGVQAEWVDGAVIVMTTDRRHVRLSRLLTGFLSSFVTIFDLGRVFGQPFLMRARPGGPGREPDIIVVLADHQDRVKPKGIEGPADLAIEFVSDESVTRDRIEKRAEFAAAGVPEYLVIESREGRTGCWFYRLGPNGDYVEIEPDVQGRYHSAVLPGLWFDPLWFVQEPLPTPELLLKRIAPDAYTAWFLAQ